MPMSISVLDEYIFIHCSNGNVQTPLYSCVSDKGTFKEIARRSTHTILAVCGREHRSNEVVAVSPPSTCSHVELTVGGKTSLIRGCCSSCFESFVGEVVKRILDTKLQQWLRLGL